MHGIEVLHPAHDFSSQRSRAWGLRRGAPSLPAHENRASTQRAHKRTNGTLRFSFRDRGLRHGQRLTHADQPL